MVKAPKPRGGEHPLTSLIEYQLFRADEADNEPLLIWQAYISYPP